VGEERRDFFISYTSADQSWAEWIAWELEAAGYRVLIQARDFRPGMNFVTAMQKGAAECNRTLIVLSAQFLESNFTEAEWTSAFAKDPTGRHGLPYTSSCGRMRTAWLASREPVVVIDITGMTTYAKPG
jgi:hypothetical protein